MAAVNRGESWAWSVTLLVTCLLGVGLGLSLGYALFRQGEGIPEVSSASDAVPSESAPPRQNARPIADDPDASSGAISQLGVALADQAVVQEKVQAAEHPAAADPVQTEEASKPDDDGVWAARHLFIAVNGQWLAEGSKKFLQELKPGGVVLRDANLQSEAQTSELVKEIKRAVGFGGGIGDLPLIAVQEESGPYSRPELRRGLHDTWNRRDFLARIGRLRIGDRRSGPRNP